MTYQLWKWHYFPFHQFNLCLHGRVFENINIVWTEKNYLHFLKVTNSTMEMLLWGGIGSYHSDTVKSSVYSICNSPQNKPGCFDKWHQCLLLPSVLLYLLPSWFLCLHYVSNTRFNSWCFIILLRMSLSNAGFQLQLHWAGKTLCMTILTF